MTSLDVVARELRAAAPWIERVHVRRSGQGCVAVLYPDALMIKARAIQQGLADDSVAAAVSSERFRRAVAAAVDRVNATLPAADRIHRYDVVGDEPQRDERRPLAGLAERVGRVGDLVGDRV